MENNVIIPTNGVEGDITSCKIETAQISVEKESVFSLTQTVNYKSYDVCTKEVVSDYSVPETTGIGAFTFFLGTLLIIFAVALFIKRLFGIKDDEY